MIASVKSPISTMKMSFINIMKKKFQVSNKGVLIELRVEKD
jgi:hypothetical protein